MNWEQKCKMPLQNSVLRKQENSVTALLPLNAFKKDNPFSMWKVETLILSAFIGKKKELSVLFWKWKTELLFIRKIIRLQIWIMKNRIVSWRAFYNFTMLIEKKCRKKFCYLLHLKIWINWIPGWAINCRYPKEEKKLSWLQWQKPMPLTL